MADIDNNRFYTLSAVAYKALADIQAGEERFSDFLGWAMDGYRELAFDNLEQFNVDQFELSPAKQVAFPVGFVDHRVVAIQDGTELTILTRDPQLAKYFNSINGINQPNKEPDYDAFFANENISLPPVNENGARLSSLNFYYGVRVDPNLSGYFDVDWKNRVFNFRNVRSGAKIYIEWISDGINPSGQTLVHPYAFQALKSYIHWQRKENDDRLGEGAKERARRLYNDQVIKLDVRMLNISIKDIAETILNSRTQIVKG